MSSWFTATSYVPMLNLINKTKYCIYTEYIYICPYIFNTPHLCTLATLCKTRWEMWMPKKPEMTSGLSALLCLTTHLATFSGERIGTGSVAQLMESLLAAAKAPLLPCEGLSHIKSAGYMLHSEKAQTMTVLSVD